MRITPLISICLSLALPVRVSSAQTPPAPAAIVAALTGTAKITLRAGTTRALQLFEWIGPSSIVTVEQEASVTIILVNGERFEMGPAARATIEPNQLAHKSGPIRALPSLPRLPHVASIGEPRAGDRAAAIRIRGQRIQQLYPSGGAATRAGATMLRWQRVAGAGTYHVNVRDGRAVVYQGDVQSESVALPAALLKPGGRYSWSVRTIGRAGGTASGDAAFATLTVENEEARRAMEAGLAPPRDARALALLAVVDHGLGLLAEAQQGVRAALEITGDDLALRRELESLQRRLSGERPAQY